MPKPATVEKPKPAARVPAEDYEPTAAELAADLSIRATPEEIARRLMRPARTVHKRAGS